MNVLRTISARGTPTTPVILTVSSMSEITLHPYGGTKYTAPTPTSCSKLALPSCSNNSPCSPPSSPCSPPPPPPPSKRVTTSGVSSVSSTSHKSPKSTSHDGANGLLHSFTTRSCNSSGAPSFWQANKLPRRPLLESRRGGGAPGAVAFCAPGTVGRCLASPSSCTAVAPVDDDDDRRAADTPLGSSQSCTQSSLRKCPHLSDTVVEMRATPVPPSSSSSSSSSSPPCWAVSLARKRGLPAQHFTMTERPCRFRTTNPPTLRRNTLCACVPGSSSWTWK
mmetsp:Transcript_66190/g.133351  ORF Transcript_66190/g.133351 Transcript_66190/m.133351 type:complete len:279 (-) Transcript_66190:334-1170(-)